jgi:hypothetical protein
MTAQPIRILVLNFQILQLRGLAVAQRRQQLRLVALFVGGFRSL